MRTTINIDDDLLDAAQRYTGIKGKTQLVNKALEQMVQRIAAERLAALGGTMPDLVVPGREGRELIPREDPR